MKRRVFLMVLAIMLMTVMVVPAMAVTWGNYNGKQVNNNSSIAATSAITKSNSSFNYAEFHNTATHNIGNTSQLMSIYMRAWAGTSGTNIAASAYVGSGGAKTATYRSGYGGVGTNYRLGLFNDSAYTVISSGTWTPR